MYSEKTRYFSFLTSWLKKPVLQQEVWYSDKLSFYLLKKFWFLDTWVTRNQKKQLSISNCNLMIFILVSITSGWSQSSKISLTTHLELLIFRNEFFSNLFLGCTPSPQTRRGDFFCSKCFITLSIIKKIISSFYNSRLFFWFHDNFNS